MEYTGARITGSKMVRPNTGLLLTLVRTVDPKSNSQINPKLTQVNPTSNIVDTNFQKADPELTPKANPGSSRGPLRS